ncbi:cytochrome-c peroxidase [Brumimicrobium aurantiacum]|uniref:Cytochrome-c peroxidase n=2 Tax=Brumimicrobium aurantiacum TaxID=1737063 RepID=A0A3E1F168_9FLAO|nr:cytochrome-c peroxidase [Brumimicrobium aurantiacum]
MSITPYELEIPSHFPAMPIPEDNPMSVEGVELGRKLFYDTRLSLDNSISCASCHNQTSGFSDNAQFSTGVNGATGNRQSMALVNLGWQSSFFWEGRAETLEEQILHPVRDPLEMNQTWEVTAEKLKQVEDYQNDFYQVFDVVNFDSTHISKAIAQFLRTLISSQSKYDVMYKFNNNLPLNTFEQELYAQITNEEWAGMDLFFSLTNGDCLHCHDGPLMQVQGLFSNNGLDETFTDIGRMIVTGNPNDKGKFKVPSLRNIEVSAPYMHDGRFSNLDEVINHYSFGVVESSTIDPMMEFSHQGGVQLDAQEHNLIKAFLKTFTDHEFLNNPDFKDPGAP